MIAASMGFAEVVSLLLSLDSTDRNCTDEHQETALYKSVIKSFGKVFKVLVEDDRCRNGAKTFNNGAGNIVDACCLSACPEIWDWLKVNGERVWEPPEDATYSFEVGMRIMDDGKLKEDRVYCMDVYKAMVGWAEGEEGGEEEEEEDKEEERAKKKEA
jgi:hypothetical protein